LKEQFLPDFADRFQSAGYGVLLYDHRNSGSSGGDTREHVDPIQQARDYCDAFDFVASLSEVDKSKVVFWGSSMSGGVAAYASALDKRMAAVILQVPFVSSASLVDAIPQVMPYVHADRANIKAGGPSAMFELFARDSEDAKSGLSKAFNRDPALIPFIEILEQRGIHWAGAVTTQSLPGLLNFEPLAMLARIAPAPLLIVAADSDHTSPSKFQLEAFEVAHEPKQLVVLKGCDHFMPYYNQTFEQNIAAQIKFLGQTVGSNQQ